MDNTVGSLTERQKSIIIGSILGDGYIRRLENRNDAFLEINHSLKAKDYVDYKYHELENICQSGPKERWTDQAKTKMAYRFFTRQHKDITKIYETFYKNKKKIINRDLKLNPLILAIWYMDDGSKTKMKNSLSTPSIYLNTQGFSLGDQKFLIHLLREIKINARLNKDKKYYRIRILQESVNTFMNLIKDYVIESMKYKLL